MACVARRRRRLLAVAARGGLALRRATAPAAAVGVVARARGAVRAPPVVSVAASSVLCSITVVLLQRQWLPLHPRVRRASAAPVDAAAAALRAGAAAAAVAAATAVAAVAAAIAFPRAGCVRRVREALRAARSVLCGVGGTAHCAAARQVAVTRARVVAGHLGQQALGEARKDGVCTWPPKHTTEIVTDLRRS